MVLAGCSPLVVDVRVLASDAMGGRDNQTEGSARARRYLIDRLDDFAVGLNPSAPGTDAFTQAFAGGTNVVALIPGDELPDEYVIIGAHYDHLGTGCDSADPADTICNGATDNATGVAAVLSIGEQLARERHGPSRSVILALWDREEDGLLGARAWIADPLVPLSQTVAYVNYDIQGANILPSLRTTTFAIGAETGGERLTAAVGRATRPGPLDTHQLSWIFGQGRSDYLPFIQAGVPTVFFSDSTGPCYHTAQDEADIVDYRKLHQQVRDGVRLARRARRRRHGAGLRPRHTPGDLRRCRRPAGGGGPGATGPRPVRCEPAGGPTGVRRRPRRHRGRRARRVRPRRRRHRALRRRQRRRHLHFG